MGKLTRNLPRFSPIPEQRVCCEEHLEEPEFFCGHCHTSVCDVCANDKHLEHTFQSLEKVNTPDKKKVQKSSTCDKSVEARVQDIEKELAKLDLEKLNQKSD